MKDLYFAPEFLEYIIIPEETAQQLIEEEKILPEVGKYTPKHLTMRPGLRDYYAGEIVRGISSDGMWQLPLRITEVVRKTFGEVTQEEAEEGGFKSPQQIVDPEKGLPRFYEEGQYDFSPEGLVTLIYFELTF